MNQLTVSLYAPFHSPDPELGPGERGRASPLFVSVSSNFSILIPLLFIIRGRPIMVLKADSILHMPPMLHAGWVGPYYSMGGLDYLSIRPLE